MATRAIRWLAGLASGLCCFCVSPTAAARKPNLVVILADDLGRADYSGYGTRDIRTPNIDRVAREGITFNHFYANSCVCSPTRAALLTGRHPDRVGVPGVIRDESPNNSWGYLAPGATLLPQLLKAAGYHSAIIGKWHLGTTAPNTPLDRGFDHFQGFLGDMMDDYWTHLRNGRNYLRQGRDPISPQGHATDLFTTWACDYLASREKAGEPFFLYLGYNAPHSPIQPPPDWLEKVRKREPAMSDSRARLVALIEHMDDGIGKVLAALDRHGHARDTLLIFTSDNGGVLPLGANNGPWRGGKLHMHEGGLRVIGLARWPARIAPASATEQRALSMDIFSTCCEVAGVEPPSDTDGVSFLGALLKGTEDAGRDRGMYFVRREGGAAYLGKTSEAYIDGDWKLVLNSPFAPPELYNLKDDPGETRNLAKEEASVFQRLSGALQRQIQRGGGTPWQQLAPAPTR